MKIKKPVLVSQQKTSIYEVDVEGTKIEVLYYYNMDDEGKGGDTDWSKPIVLSERIRKWKTIV